MRAKSMPEAIHSFTLQLQQRKPASTAITSPSLSFARVFVPCKQCDVNCVSTAPLSVPSRRQASTLPLAAALHRTGSDEWAVAAV